MHPSALQTRLADGLAGMHLDLAADTQAHLLAYLELLAKWNRAYNLTAVRDPDAMVARHLLDALAVLPFVQGTTLADLGSGAGLPGIPLAIARRDLAVTLIESNGKKARFLREVVRSLPLPNVTVRETRVQDAAGPFDVVAARAFASLADMLSWGGHLLASDGRWLAMKGRIDPHEIGAIPEGFRVIAVHRLEVPGIDGDRNLVALARSA